MMALFPADMGSSSSRCLQSGNHGDDPCLTKSAAEDREMGETHKICSGIFHRAGARSIRLSAGTRHNRRALYLSETKVAVFASSRPGWADAATFGAGLRIKPLRHEREIARAGRNFQ